jgi:hypothetical protein
MKKMNKKSWMRMWRRRRRRELHTDRKRIPKVR